MSDWAFDKGTVDQLKAQEGEHTDAHRPWFGATVSVPAIEGHRGLSQGLQGMATPGIVRQITTVLSSTALCD